MSTTEKLYITEKEAVIRYGYSRSWFQRARWEGYSPPFIKVHGGRVLYPLQQTDQWFADFGLKTSTSQVTEEMRNAKR